jgi:TonB family protein
MDLPSPRPNIAGLTSPVQQAELRLLLAGRWPALKPLPIFKCETGEYRASIEFDKTRGEWVCRKTSLPSNKVKELRGGLKEITMALPHGHGEVFAEYSPADQQEQELEKDANRRLQAMLEWKEKYENGAFYSGLQDYLSKSQRDDIDDSIRLTLTARQLQFNAKNVAEVFDALSKAGGKLASLLEAAQRNKTQQGADVPPKAEACAPNAVRHAPVEAIHPMRDRRLQTRTTLASTAYTALDASNGGIVLNISETGMAVAAADPLVVADYLPQIRFRLPNVEQRIKVSAQVVWLAESKKTVGIRFVDLTAEARNEIANWIASEKRSPEVEGLTPAPVESLVAAKFESFAEEPLGSVIPEQDQHSSPELIAHAGSRPPQTVTPEIRDGNAPSLVEDLPIKAHGDASVAVFGPQIRTRKTESSAKRVENSPSRSCVLELSGFHVAAALFLLAAISLAAGLTAGLGPLGSRFWDTQKSLPAADHTSQALLNRLQETTSRTFIPPDANTSASPAVNPPAPAPAESNSEGPATRSLNPAPEDPTARVAPIGPSLPIAAPSFPDSDKPEAGPERKEWTGPNARNAPPAEPPSADSPKAVVPMSVTPASPAPRRAMAATRTTPHQSSPSAILFTGPGDGKPFRLILPEKPIAASSSFAITSQLTILVSPDRGPAPAREPARLQAGELVSFVWPRYPRPGNRQGSSETVKVRTTIGEFGQVMDVQRVSGSLSLLPAVMSAIRLWRYKPTLLNNRPVQAQQDVTIEFRPPRHLPRVASRHTPRTPKAA